MTLQQAQCTIDHINDASSVVRAQLQLACSGQEWQLLAPAFPAKHPEIDGSSQEVAAAAEGLLAALSLSSTDQRSSGHSAPGSATSDVEVLPMQRDLGLAHDAHACTSWGVGALSPEAQQAELVAVQRACNALRLCMGAIAAARIAAVALRQAGRCHAALQVVGMQLQELRTVLKQRRLWDAALPCKSNAQNDSPSAGPQAVPNGTAAVGIEDKRTIVARSIKKALSGLQEPFESCLELLDDCLQEEGSIEDETVVYLAANIDSLYYTLLDHHLTSGEVQLFDGVLNDAMAPLTHAILCHRALIV